MNHIYETYDSRYVQATLLFVGEDDYAYADSEATVRVDAPTIGRLFHDGLVIMDGTTAYLPVSYDVTEGVGTLTYVTSGDGGAASLASLKSSEYESE